MIELTWLGTAGFIAKSQDWTIGFDPFLNCQCHPASEEQLKLFGNVQAIFVGHGHFDHTQDIPYLSKHSDFKVFAPGVTRALLKLRGINSKRLFKTEPREFLFQGPKVQCFRSQHVRFDWPLVRSTLARCSMGDCFRSIGLGLAYPQDHTQTYLFQFGSKKCLFISSAGCSQDELKTYSNLDIDILLAPLQGHSEIQKIAAEQCQIIAPKIVIPHHWDNSFPPLSQDIAIEPFKDQLRKLGYKGQIEIPQKFVPMQI